VLDASTPTKPKLLKEELDPLVWKIEMLRPGETRVIDYRLIANGVEALSEVEISAHGLKKSDKWVMKVVEANLEVNLRGPDGDKALVKESAVYELLVKNSGTAEVKNVLVNCTIPRDVKVVKQSSGGQQFPDSVQWVVPQLKPNEEKLVRLTVQGQKEGSRMLSFAVKANPGQKFEKTLQTDFYGAPTLDWKTEGTPTTSVGEIITYTVNIQNRGDGPARRLLLRAEVPSQAELVDGTIPSTFKTTASGITFDPITLAAKGDLKISLRLRAKAPGEAVFKFLLYADHLGEEPLRSEKMTNITGR
jgi:uncharacterized repeat protein (TIGR01451 family)